MNEGDVNVNDFHDWLSEEIFRLVVNDMVSHDDVIEALEFELDLARNRKEEEEVWDDELADDDEPEEDKATAATKETSPENKESR